MILLCEKCFTPLAMGEVHTLCWFCLVKNAARPTKPFNGIYAQIEYPKFEGTNLKDTWTPEDTDDE